MGILETCACYRCANQRFQVTTIVENGMGIINHNWPQKGHNIFQKTLISLPDLKLQN